MPPTHEASGPRRAMPPILLISEAGCVKQRLHYDYDPKKVQDLIKQKNYVGVPVSVLVGFTPGGSRLTIQLQKDEPETVEIDFGEMLIFTGDVVHAGGAYTDFNIRGFLHVEHAGCLTFEHDVVHVQTQPKPRRRTSSRLANNPITSV